VSGGAYNYSGEQIRSVTYEIEAGDWQIDSDYHRRSDLTALRRWLLAHMELVAVAVHAIEWIDSGDWSPGDEVDPIKRVADHGKTFFIEKSRS